jgi:divalent metal cation (Fe/Co/Zn/Cd) transporter
VLLAVYVSYDSVKSLLRHEAPDESLPGIVLAALSLIVMPLLVRAKRRVARGLNSGALMADSKQTELCTYLSAILLGGLLLNALLGWVVGRSNCSANYGADNCKGGTRSSTRRNLLR